MRSSQLARPLALLALCISALGVPAFAQCGCDGGQQVLYSYSSQKVLYRLDGYQAGPLTAVAVAQHPGSAFWRAAMHPTTGVVYGVRGYLNGVMWSFDPASGQLTQLGPLGFVNGIAQLDFDAAGVLWTRSASGRVYTVDLVTGGTTLVANPGGGGNYGGALDALGRLYTVRLDRDLERYDPATGLLENLGPLAPDTYGLEIDCDGRVFAGDIGSDVLRELDPETGAVLSTRGLGHPGDSYDLLFARPAQESTCIGLGTPYCDPALANSTGAPGTLTAYGSLSVVDDTLELRAAGLPPGESAYLLAGQTQGFLPFVGGSQGVLCLVGVIARFTTQLGAVDAAGRFAVPVDLGALPLTPPHAVQPGETWNFQVWYRDQNPGPTSNFTAGLELSFL